MPGGRPPKPTDLKVLQGTARPDRLNPDEPKPVPGEPECPTWLDAVAQTEWARVCTLLREQRRLSLDVAPALELYCQAYSDWRWAVARLTRSRRVMKTSTGYMAPRPEIQMRDRSHQLMTRMLTELGLTPSSKVRVKVPAAQAQSKLQEFLRRDSHNSQSG